MNYMNLYWDVIRKGVERKKEYYTKKSMKKHNFEIHHAIPKYLGGTDAEWNLIPLTVKEHAFVHLMLQKDQCGRDVKKIGLKRYCRNKIVGQLVNSKHSKLYNLDNLFKKEEIQFLTLFIGARYNNKRENKCSIPNIILNVMEKTL